MVYDLLSMGSNLGSFVLDRSTKPTQTLSRNRCLVYHEKKAGLNRFEIRGPSSAAATLTRTRRRGRHPHNLQWWQCPRACRKAQLQGPNGEPSFRKLVIVSGALCTTELSVTYRTS